MKQFDCHGKKINYDAPGQIGAGGKKPQKPRVDRFRQQLDRLVEYYDQRKEYEMPLRVTLAQIRQLCKVHPEDMTWRPTGDELYHSHPLVVTEES